MHLYETDVDDGEVVQCFVHPPSWISLARVLIVLPTCLQNLTTLQREGAVARRFFQPVTRRSRVVVAARYRC